jgi:zinc transport system substrate-binding protein
MRLTDGESSQTKVLNNKHSSDQDEPESPQHQEHHVDSAHKDSAHKDSAHKSHDEAHHKPHYVHAYLGEDPHIWLSPIKALQIAALVRDNTSLLYPQYKPQLAANYQRFVEKMQQLDLQLNIEFSSLKGLGFIVFHDAYARFIEYYQLNQVAALTINPAKRPGAKHLADIRNIIQQSHPVCVFSEPQFSKVAVESLIRNFSINVGELDPLATNVKVTQDRYISFIQGFARQFIDCLSRP